MNDLAVALTVRGLLAAIAAALTVSSVAAQQSEATRRLLERNEMFEPAIIQVAENVYTAIGYQVSANTMIVDVLWTKAREAMTVDDPLGAAQLAQHVIRLRPDDRAPKLLMADALDIIGERTFNAPARSYTLSSANRYRAQATRSE